MKKVITKVAAMNIQDAVEYTVDKIELGFTGFIVQTEFATIPVEVRNATPCIGSGHASGWKTIYPTEFMIKNRDGKYEWYVLIDYKKNQSRELTRMQVVGTFCQIMYCELRNHNSLLIAKDAIAKEIKAALIKLYYECFVCAGSSNIEYWSRELACIQDGWMRGNFNTSKFRALKMATRQHYEDMMIMADMVIDSNMSNFKSCGFKYNAFGNKFYDFIFTVTIRPKTAASVNEYEKLTEGIGGEISAFDLLKRFIG